MTCFHANMTQFEIGDQLHICRTMQVSRLLAGEFG
jgi:DNA-binding transcriptional regulator LsrR (DeoR family)